jgi:hypothetical protein
MGVLRVHRVSKVQLARSVHRVRSASKDCKDQRVNKDPWVPKVYGEFQVPVEKMVYVDHPVNRALLGGSR